MGRGDREVAALARPGRHVIEVMPGRIQRRVRLGLRRRRLVRADATLRRARRLPARSSTRPIASARRDSRRGLQPLRPQRQLPGGVLVVLSSRSGTRPSGARRSTSMANGAGPVREFVTANAATGSTSTISTVCGSTRRRRSSTIRRDTSWRELSRGARKAAGERSIMVVAENEQQQVRHVEPVDAGGYGMDGLWNDDFHHACRVAATGHAEFYYADYAGSPQEIISAHAVGLSVPGAVRPRQKQRRGTPTRAPAARRSSSTSCRTTTRSPTRRRRCGCTSSRRPADIGRSPRCCCWGRRRRCCSWDRSSPRRRRSSTSPTMKSTLRSWSAKGAGVNSATFPRPPGGAQGELARSRGTRDVRAVEDRLGRRRAARAERCCCTAT